MRDDDEGFKVVHIKTLCMVWFLMPDARADRISAGGDASAPIPNRTVLVRQTR